MTQAFIRFRNNDWRSNFPEWIIGTSSTGEQRPPKLDHDEEDGGPPNAVPLPAAEHSPDRALPIHTTEAAMAFQIRATILSWSYAWNRGDVVGYCDSYTDTARYVSVNAKGGVTVLQGKENIAACFANVFFQCQSVQTKLEQRRNNNNNSGDVMVAGVAGIMEYRNLEIQAIPPSHAVVFGEYHLTFGEAKVSEQRGVFTLNLVEAQGIWRIQSEHSSAMVNAK
jgi:ketosteroid isomerase-like protein